MKNQEKLLNICVWSAVVLFALRCFISWNSILSDFSLYDIFGYAGEAVSISVILSGFYEKLLWRINPLEKSPKLAKCYKGTLKSSYANIERSATLKIKQSFTSVHVTLITDESRSNSLSASVDEILGEMQLTYCYLNTPKTAYRDRSAIHYGTARLTITGPGRLEGQYYTDRKTIGDMIFTAAKRQ